MKVSFYHLGNSWIGFKGIMDKLGVSVVKPPKITKSTHEYGVRYSPESACEPFKQILGEYHNVLEAGADTIFHLDSGKKWGCRLSQYATGPKTILTNKGYKFDMLPWGGKSSEEIFNIFKKKIPNLTNFKFKMAQLFGIIKLAYIEWLEDHVNQLRPYAVEKEQCNELLKKGLELIDNAKRIRGLSRAKKKILKSSKKISIDKTKKLPSVIIVGDLFSILDPVANKDLFEKLGKEGVVPYRSFYLSYFLRRAGKIGPWGKKSFKYREKFALPYIDKELTIGSLGSAGDTVHALEDGKINGIIHIYPFTCMPENVNSAIFKKIAKDYNVPLLSLVLGEHEGEVHQNTRIEAFIDVLKK